jgi:3-dehydroquinate dehydratase-1
MASAPPAIVGTVADLDTLSNLPQLEAAVTPCDFLEFRIDALLDAPEDLLDVRLKSSPRPIVLTVRDPAEGGVGALEADRRRALYERWLPQAAWVDVEIRNLVTFPEVVRHTQASQATLLGSMHDFQGTPDASELEDRAKQARDHGVDALKMAMTVRDGRDLATLLHIFERERAHLPVAAMGMGPLGMSSRVLFAEAGSLLTYTYLQKANAPGQWSSQEMRRLFDRMQLPPGFTGDR